MNKNRYLYLPALLLLAGCSPSASQTADNNIIETTSQTTAETKTEIIQNNQDDIPLLLEQAIGALEDENYQKAIDTFTSVIEIDELNTGAYLGRADACIAENESAGNLALALADYEAAQSLAPELADVWLGIIDVHIRMHDFGTALALAEQGYEQTGDPAVGEKAEQIKSGSVRDAENKIRRRILYDGESVIIYYTDYTYSPDKRLQALTTYNRQGEQIDHLEYEYDESGNILKNARTRTSGKLDAVYHSYDENGHLSDKITRDTADDSFRFHDTFEYDDAGNCIRSNSISEAGDLLGYELYTHDEQGNTVSQEIYEKGRLISYRTQEFNEQGQRLKESFYNADDTLIRYHLFPLDDNGNCLGMEIYDGDGVLTEYSTSLPNQ